MFGLQVKSITIALAESLINRYIELALKQFYEVTYIPAVSWFGYTASDILYYELLFAEYCVRGGAVKPVACGKENVSAASVRDERKKLATSICLEAQAMNSAVSEPAFPYDGLTTKTELASTDDLTVDSPKDYSHNNNKSCSLRSPIEVDEETLTLTNLPPQVLPKPQLPEVTLLQKSRAGELPKGALYIGTSDKIKGGYKHTQEFVLVATKPTDGGSNSESVNTRVSNSNITEDAHKCAPAKEPGIGLYKEIHRKLSQSGSAPLISPTSPGPHTKSKEGEEDALTTRRKPIVSEVIQPSKKQPSHSAGDTFSSMMLADVVDAHWPTGSYSDIRSANVPGQLSVDTFVSTDNPFSLSTGSHTPKSSAGSTRSLSSPSTQYREIQRGGEIPFSGLRKPAPLSPPPKPEVPRKIPSPVAGYNRDPVPVSRVQKDISDAKRRELLSKIEKDEKRKKAVEEEAERRARRHSDYFTIKEKSPIAYDRYDRSHIQMAASAPNSPAHYSGSGLNSPRSIVSGCSGLTAKALYHFPARHPRELSVRKGDQLIILRRIDANWYEASKDAERGIIPVSYVQILREVSLSPSPPIRPSSPMLKEGTAVAKYNFNPQTGSELALKRGEQVSLVRRIDRNWYEGRIQGSVVTGIFPASYVQVISEPGMYK
ncbi:CAP [Bugula neritina]|uniref:CAP n=1 Tax=Bugula neritina TaxID=10212 RepID=A0A7J7JHD7_BUGNE|nr:CAP [Bugula neritina]